MRKNMIALTVLVVVLILIGLDLMLAKSESPVRDKKLLTEIDWGRVTGLKLKSPNTDLEFYKLNGVWYVIREKRYRADQVKVQALLNSLSVLEKDNILTGSETEHPGKYSLDKPPVRLEILEGEKSTVINFGTTNPAGRKVYCQFPGDKKIYLTNGYILIRLFWGLERYRDRALFHFENGDIVKVDLSFTWGKDYDIRLLRVNETWQMDYPIKLPADDEYVQLLLLAAKSLRAERILDDPGPEFHNSRFKEIRFKIILSDKNSNHYMMEVGSVNPELEAYFVRHNTDGAVFNVSIDAVNKLMMNKFDLASRDIITTDITDIDSFSWSVPGKPDRRLSRVKENTWTNPDTGTEHEQRVINSNIIELIGLDVVSLDSIKYRSELGDLKPVKLSFNRTVIYFYRKENYYAVLKQVNSDPDPRVWRVTITRVEQLKKLFSN